MLAPTRAAPIELASQKPIRAKRVESELRVTEPTVADALSA